MSKWPIFVAMCLIAESWEYRKNDFLICERTSRYQEPKYSFGEVPSHKREKIEYSIARGRETTGNCVRSPSAKSQVRNRVLNCKGTSHYQNLSVHSARGRITSGKLSAQLQGEELLPEILAECPIARRQVTIGNLARGELQAESWVLNLVR